MLTHIEFENYRIFKKRQAIDIKPITIVFGKNNSGKSALLKLPSLIESINSVSAIDELTNKKDDVRLFQEYWDLVYGRAFKDVKLAFKNEKGHNGKVVFAVNEDGKIYLPEPMDYNKQDFTDFIVDYIGPFRKILQPSDIDMRIEKGLNQKSGIDGSNNYQYLLMDADTVEKKLNKRVSDWYKDNFENWGVSVNNTDKPTYRIEMAYKEMRIPIVDSGTGITQSLPIVIRACRKCEKPTLIVIEEPETHLHPAAHAELAQLIAQSAKVDSNRRYLIETHSRNFLLRLRRMIAYNELDIQDVAFYYVNFDEDLSSSSVREIKIDGLGQVDWWPKGIFEETMDEIVALAQKQFEDENID